LSKNAQSYSSSFQHDERGRAQAIAALEVHGHPADQERRVQARPVRRKASRLVVVVLPCVPATTSRRLAPDELLGQQRGQAGHALLAVEDDLHLGLPRDRALPITTRSASGARSLGVGGAHLDAEASSWVDMGG
jgi:hypothetical protein